MSNVCKNSHIIENVASILDIQSFRSRKFFCAPEKKKPDSEIEEEIVYQNDVSKTQSFSEPNKIDVHIKYFKTEFIEIKLQNVTDKAKTISIRKIKQIDLIT